MPETMEIIIGALIAIFYLFLIIFGIILLVTGINKRSQAKLENKPYKNTLIKIGAILIISPFILGILISVIIISILF